jgi:hypothetical protein
MFFSGTTLPQGSNLWGHFQSCRFGFTFGAWHGDVLSGFDLYFKQLYVIACLALV